jgi:hypothetical protein
MTLDTQLTWPNAINQSRKEETHRLGVSFSKGVLLYKQLIRPLVGYAYHIWRSAARLHVRKLQVVQSKRLNISTNPPLYIINKKIY